MSDNAAKTARLGLGQAIEVRRAHLGLKRKDLAEKASLSYPYISELENGGKEPSAKALRQIADALEMGVADLIALGEQYQDGNDEPMTSPPLFSLWALSNLAEKTTTAPGNLWPGSGAVAQTAATFEPPLAGTDEVRALVRSIVREEVERLVADELPVIVARELRKVLADPSGTD